MSKCFVMQPFDGGVFDKRFDDVIAPAIREAELQPYRVDRDPHVEIPIEDIESGIKGARICLAEITTNNPNVWFELGYAIALRKDVVLICSEERETPFPFDVQHRRIIEYTTDSPRDFTELQSEITRRLSAILEKQERLQDSLASPINPSEGLESHEMIALISVMENQMSPDTVVSAHTVKDDMANSGFTDIAVTLSLRGLQKKGLIEIDQAYDDRYNEEYSGYRVTPKGEEWLFNNQDKLSLKREDLEPEDDYTFEPDDDLPF